MFDPLSLNKVCTSDKEVAIDYHHCSALKLRNTCRCSLTQRLVR